MITRRFGIAACAAAALAIVACPVTALDSVRELPRAEEAYRAHLLRDRPDLATRYGINGAQERLVPVTEATIAADSASLAEFAGHLAAFDRAVLEPDAADRLDTLRVRVARELEPYRTGAWWSDPAVYLDLGPRAVFEAAAQPNGGPCTRTRYATGRLRALPEVMRAARINLHRYAPTGPDEAAPWLAAIDSLQALPDRLEGCREGMRVADLVEADSLAVAAVQRFVRFLREERDVNR
jgi:hypothetical protein